MNIIKTEDLSVTVFAMTLDLFQRLPRHKFQIVLSRESNTKFKFEKKNNKTVTNPKHVIICKNSKSRTRHRCGFAHKIESTHSSKKPIFKDK